jgi:hypothetical protein
MSRSVSGRAQEAIVRRGMTHGLVCYSISTLVRFSARNIVVWSKISKLREDSSKTFHFMYCTSLKVCGNSGYN